MDALLDKLQYMSIEDPEFSIGLNIISNCIDDLDNEQLSKYRDLLEKIFEIDKKVERTI